MLRGDISNADKKLTGWDYLLLIDIKYKNLFKLAIKNGWIRLSKLFFKYNYLAISQLLQDLKKGENVVILVTHENLKKIFEGLEVETYQVFHLKELHEFKTVYSCTTKWVAAGVASYVAQFVDEIEVDKNFKKVLGVVSDTLLSQLDILAAKVNNKKSGERND